MYLKKLLVFLTILSILASCRSQYAPIHDPVDRYIPAFRKALRAEVHPMERKIQPQLSGLELTEPSIEAVPVFYPEIPITDRSVIIPVIPLRNPTHTDEVKRQDPKTKAQQKRKKNWSRFWRKVGSNLVIGVVFLAIAIALALLHLESLAILFGLASILFLIFGLKKVFKFRRRQIRNPFRKNL